jgi:23S rRNA (adenine2503-C2)-methyltransferase
VGLIQGIRTLLSSSLKVKLAISLNFPDEEVRKHMMPVSKENPTKDILKLAREYSRKKDMVTFAYVLIHGINDSIKDADRLMKLVKGIPSKINLIPYNPHPALPFKRPTKKRITEFYNRLLTSSHTITMRKSKGQDIGAACGQLVASKSNSTDGVRKR